MELNDYETAKEVRAFKIIRNCVIANCSGIMIPTGIVYTMYPPEYTHKCTICSNTQAFDKCYPIIRYEEV